MEAGKAFPSVEAGMVDVDVEAVIAFCFLASACWLVPVLPHLCLEGLGLVSILLVCPLLVCTNSCLALVAGQGGETITNSISVHPLFLWIGVAMFVLAFKKGAIPFIGFSVKRMGAFIDQHKTWIDCYFSVK